ncbi:MAG: hypothetical protein ACFN4E_11200 [Corynebacterium matruchotii]
MKKIIIAADITLKLAAWHFLYHRPNRHKRAWFLATLVPVIGPLWFLSCGNHEPGRE